MISRLLALSATAFVAVLGLACQPATQDLSEIKETQKQILAKLEALEKAQKDTAAARRGPPPEDFDKVYSIDIGASPVLGSKDAKVTLVEFSDFECPFCARATPDIKKLVERYPGKLNIVYKHFPLSFHPHARPTAIASLAAQDAGCFWEFHDELYEATTARELDAEKVESYAKDAGCDVAKFKTSLEANKEDYEKRVNADIELGQSVDVRGTPTLYIGGKKVRNRSVDGMAAMIDEQLAGSGE